MSVVSAARLGKAALLSLTLHGLLMFGLDRVVDRPSAAMPARKVLSAVVVPPARANSSPVTTMAKRALSPPAAVVSGGVPRSIPLSATAMPPVLTAVAASERPDAGRPLATLATEPVRHAELAGSHAEPRSGVDGEELRQYKLAIAIQARRFRRYPAHARERGWEGTTEIAVVVIDETPWPAVELEKSSGYSVLDDQALEMIRLASRAAFVPSSLRQRGVRFVLPVDFSLDQ